LKLATWNVAVPVSETRRRRIRTWIDQVRADVLVLTETHDGLDPGYAHQCCSAAGRDGSEPAAHRWVSICSHATQEPMPTADPQRTAAARVFPADSGPFVVYGTVLPWLGSAWREHTAEAGVAFREALAVQLSDWLELRSNHPHDELFVLGDFNQDLVSSGPRYYGSGANRRCLDQALKSAGLVALTGGENDPVRRDSFPCACIDHICGRADSAWRVASTERWPNEAAPPKSLSDHFGVAVEFTRVK